MQWCSEYSSRNFQVNILISLMVHFYKFNIQGFISFNCTVSRTIQLFFCILYVLGISLYISLDVNLCNKLYKNKDLYFLLVDCFFKEPNIYHTLVSTTSVRISIKRICICTCDYNVDPICNCYRRL